VLNLDRSTQATWALRGLFTAPAWPQVTNKTQIDCSSAIPVDQTKTVLLRIKEDLHQKPFPSVATTPLSPELRIIHITTFVRGNPQGHCDN